MKTIISELPERDDFIHGRNSLEIGYPWLAPGSILMLEMIVKPEFKVLELGLGGSTIFWAKNCNSVKTLETKDYWVADAKPKLDQFKNVEIHLGDRNKLLEIISELPDEYYDIVSADSCPVDTDRLTMANAVASKVKKGGWLVIDNYWEWGMEKFEYSKWNVYTYDDFNWSGKGTRVCQKGL
jgi:hypothetical protein